MSEAQDLFGTKGITRKKFNAKDFVKKRRKNITTLPGKPFSELLSEECPHQWIDVKDKVPEKKGLYIVYNGQYMHIENWIELSQYKKMGWWSDDSMTSASKGMITHWQPLLEPPT